MNDSTVDRAPADVADDKTRRRRLIVVPVVHVAADMGSAHDEVRRAYIAQKGQEAWDESRRAIDRFWRELQRKIAGLDLDPARLRLYQDGLPVCGREADIVRDLAETAGPNYRILLDLMAQGAALEGTESAELLIREYRLWRPGARAPAADEGGGASAQRLLDERDRFIARRIDATLLPGETGLLFLGALHNVADRLPATIEVRFLDDLAGAPRP